MTEHWTGGDIGRGRRRVPQPQSRRFGPRTLHLDEVEAIHAILQENQLTVIFRVGGYEYLSIEAVIAAAGPGPFTTFAIIGTLSSGSLEVEIESGAGIVRWTDANETILTGAATRILDLIRSAPANALLGVLIVTLAVLVIVAVVALVLAGSLLTSTSSLFQPLPLLWSVIVLVSSTVGVTGLRMSDRAPAKVHLVRRRDVVGLWARHQGTIVPILVAIATVMATLVLERLLGIR